MDKLLTISAIMLSILSLTSSPQIDAAIYKWKDANGQINYSTIVPEGVKKDDIAKKIASISKAPKQTTTKADETTENDTESENNKSNTYCEKQQKIVETLKNNPYIKWKVGDQEVLLEGDKKAAKVEEIEKDIKKYCSSQLDTYEE